MKTSEELLKIAENDLQASIILYNNRYYPQAIFYFQQSVEKAAKSFGLLTGIINENQLKGKKGIGHNPLKIHKKIISEQKKGLEKIDKAVETIQNFKAFPIIQTIDINELAKLTDESLRFFNNLIDESYFFSKEEIMGFIDDINNIKKQTRELNEEIIDLDFEKEFDRVKNEIIEFLDILYKYNPHEIEKAKKELDDFDSDFIEEIFYNKIKPLILDICYINVSLFYLSLITFPHAISARYPDTFNPLKVYNKDFALIQLFKECSEIMEEILEIMHNFYKNVVTI